MGPAKIDVHPSYYLKRQTHATFMWDPLAIRNRDLTGLDCLMWGNDYPHHEGSFPFSAEWIDKQFDGVPAQRGRPDLPRQCRRDLRHQGLTVARHPQPIPARRKGRSGHRSGQGNRQGHRVDARQGGRRRGAGRQDQGRPRRGGRARSGQSAATPSRYPATSPTIEALGDVVDASGQRTRRTRHPREQRRRRRTARHVYQT